MGKAGAITHIRDEAQAAGPECLSPERVCSGNSTQTPLPVKHTNHHATCGTGVTAAEPDFTKCDMFLEQHCY